MPRVASFKSNFSAGEISGLLQARLDAAVYQNGLETCENFWVTPEGAVQNIPGLRYVGHAKADDAEARLIPFEFSDDDAYVLEFGNQYVRFYRSQSRLLESTKTITGATAANPVVITANSHGYANGDDVYITGIAGMTELNGRVFRVANKTTHTFELTDLLGNNIDGSGYAAYSSGGTAGRVYTISSPYSTADLPDLQIAQSADVMWIVHPSYKPRKLSRSGSTWSFANYAPTADPFSSTDNYPAAVAFYEDRLWFGGTNDNPQKLWASVAGDYEDMTVGTAASAALEYTIASRKIDRIKWLLPEQFLLAGTANGVFVVRASGYDEAVTPTNVQIKKHVSYPCSGEVPELVQDVVMFPGKQRDKVFALTYDANRGKYTGRNATIRNRDVTGIGVKQMAYQENPNGILWMVREDGQLIGLTAEWAEQVTAWFRRTTDGTVESICVIPGTDGDELWAIVNRTIDGNTVRYVEFLESREDTVLDDCFFVDSGATYDGSATTTITGLHHLEGESVSIWADGANHPAKTVSDGSITLDREASTVQIGLPYNATIRTLRLEGGSANGTAQGKQKRIHKVSARLYRTLNLQYGKDTDSLTTLPFRFGSDLMDSAPPIYTGDKDLAMESGWDTAGQVAIRQNLPAPMTLLGMAMEFVSNDG